MTDLKKMAFEIGEWISGHTGDNSFKYEKEKVEFFIQALLTVQKEAREEALEEAANIARTEEEPDPNPSDGIRDVVSFDPVRAILAGIRATKKSIESRILNLKTPKGGS